MKVLQKLEFEKFEEVENLAYHKRIETDSPQILNPILKELTILIIISKFTSKTTETL